MKNAFFASVAALVLLSGTANASETKTVQRTVTTYDLKTDFPDFYKKVQAVCANKSFHLSDKASLACQKDAFPSVTKSGRFRNAGVGAELNTLAAQ